MVSDVKSTNKNAIFEIIVQHSIEFQILDDESVDSMIREICQGVTQNALKEQLLQRIVDYFLDEEDGDWLDQLVDCIERLDDSIFKNFKSTTLDKIEEARPHSQSTDEYS